MSHEGEKHQDGNGELRASAPARDAADGVPSWLTALAAAAPRMSVPELRRPPAAAGRAAAVLILFGDGPHGPDLLLIERAAELRNHAGQPAFPGGAIDESDGGPVRAALREAAEETGLDPDGVHVLAVLPELYIWRSDFRVTPVLAWWRSPVAVTPGDPGEIAAVARVPVADLASPANRIVIRYPSGHIGPAFPGRRPGRLGFHGDRPRPVAGARRLGTALGFCHSDHAWPCGAAGGLADDRKLRTPGAANAGRSAAGCR